MNKTDGLIRGLCHHGAYILARARGGGDKQPNKKIAGSKTYDGKNTAAPQIMSFCSTWFCYNIDEVPWELNSCSYQLACSNTGLLYIILLEVAERPDGTDCLL